MSATAQQSEGYWVAFFALRIAQSLRGVKDKRERAMLREDLDLFLRSGVASAHVTETVRREMRR